MSEAIIKHITQPIYIYDKESLRFLDANDAALKLYGYSLDEFQQMDLTDLYTPEDIQTLLDTSVELLKEGEFSKPFKQRKKDGSYAQVKINRINYQQDDTEAYLNILEDVSSSSELEKNKQVFKTAFDNTDDMIFITDSEGKITFANEQINKNLGISSADLINKPITSLCDDEDKLFINDSVFQSHIKETVTFTIQLKNSEGGFVESDVVSTPIYDNNNVVDSFVLIAKTVSEPNLPSLKNKKEAKELGEKKSAEKLEFDKSEPIPQNNTFFAGIFHELLTPMNVILGFTQELTESLENPSPEQKEAIDIINQNRLSLLSLMNSIIEYSDIQFNSSEEKISEISITDIIESFDKNINDITGVKDLKFAYGKISSSLKFFVDKKQFLSLLNNLFRLISKVTSQKKIYFSAYPVEDDSFNISVSDGFGRSSAPLIETLKLLFIENKDPKLFGLSKLYTQIINSLLKKLNGQFIVINENTDKADIAFKFPLKLTEETKPLPVKENDELVEQEVESETEETMEDIEPEHITVSEEIEIEEEGFNSLETETVEAVQPEELKQEQQAQIVQEVKEPVRQEEVAVDKKIETAGKKNGLSSLRCLYIEDQVDSQILFKVQMKDLRNIQFASSFEEALPLLESSDFDFIIMDINLQGEYNGIDALKVIHQIPKLQKVPIIAVTAYVLPGDKEKFIATGFTDFISKPIFRDKLLESLKKIFVN
jgi:PAS domain S-box-containing protein